MKENEQLKLISQSYEELNQLLQTRYEQVQIQIDQLKQTTFKQNILDL